MARTALAVVAAEGPGGLELSGVEAVEQGLVRQGLLAEQLGELLPENGLVGLAAVVFHHGGGARPHCVDELLGVVAPGGDLLGQQAEIAFDELVLVHGEQRPVQVE